MACETLCGDSGKSVSCQAAAHLLLLPLLPQLYAAALEGLL